MCLLGVAVILLFLTEISIKLIHSCFCMRGTQVYPQYIILSLLLSLCPCVSVPVPFLVYLSASFGSLGPFPCDPTPFTVPVPSPVFLLLSGSLCPCSFFCPCPCSCRYSWPFPCVLVFSCPGPCPFHSTLLYSVLCPLPIHPRATIP